jgi:polyisoprenyl-teichoic acid--peptidoglycan teichoic acid transferase
MSRPIERTKMTRPRNRRHQSQWVWVLLIVFLAAAMFTAYLTFAFFRNIVLSSNPATTRPFAAKPKSTQPGPEPTLDPQALNIPMQPSNGLAPVPWDGKSRVNILLMGLDYGDWEGREGPSRTDTMILLTLDPATRTAGMLSIPRDLWVQIPGHDYAKINTAYFLGEAEGLPGGGPGLAVDTVEKFLDTKINYYAQVDFNAFERFIDELGGVEIDVPEEISVDPIGPHNTVLLKPGKHLLDGETALAYARNRDTAGSDFDRAQRQQQVILAIRDRILSLNMLKLLIQKSPVLYQQLKDGIHTNMTLQEMISMAWIAQQIPKENIKRGAIGPDQVIEDTSPNGLSILRPITDKVRLLRDEIFSTTGPARPVATATGDPSQLMGAEKARVAVLNGTSVPGLASRTTEYLASKGIQVTTTDNAQELYGKTAIINYSGKLYTAQFLASLLGIQPDQLYNRYDPNSPVDITILVGNDWAEKNSMP